MIEKIVNIAYPVAMIVINFFIVYYVKFYIDNGHFKLDIDIWGIKVPVDAILVIWAIGMDIWALVVQARSAKSAKQNKTKN